MVLKDVPKELNSRFMKIALIFIFTSLITIVTSTIGQVTHKESGTSIYSGGIDSLDKHIAKNIRNKINLSSDHFFFFKVSIIKKGIITIEELYGHKNAISNVVKEAIKATANNWSRPENAPLNIVIPIFFTAEKSDRNLNTFSYLDFKHNRETVYCILFPPIVYTYYLPSH